MLRLVAGHLRSGWARALTLLLTVMVATASFSLLSNSAQTARLRVLGTVSESFRSTYDLLVRPVGDRSAIEERSGSVRPNYQSGIFGGITSAQLATIRSLAELRSRLQLATSDTSSCLGNWISISTRTWTALRSNCSE
jgi:putative ABC transport system permease protein